MRQPHKPFPWKCPECRQRERYPVVESYECELEHDGRAYRLRVPDFELVRCRQCGSQTYCAESSERLNDALRRAAGLLMPDEIRAGRERLGVTQKELAAQLGVAEATLCRWETGGQMQQRVMDRLLRAYFAVPELRAYLAAPGS